LRDGYRFWLLVFKTAEPLLPATWKNVLAAVAEYYPQYAEIIKIGQKELRRTSFALIEKELKSRINDVKLDRLTGNNDIDFSFEHLWQLRYLLFKTVGISGSFKGDGFIRKADGRKGNKEYIMLRCIITELPDYLLFDLNIKNKNDG